MWREGVTPGNATCSTYSNTRDMVPAEIIRFDELENPSALGGGPCFLVCWPAYGALPAASRVSTRSSHFPPMPAGSPSVGGWMYLNLNNANALGTYSAVRASQNWVVVSLFAESRYGVDFNASAFGNGCSAAVLWPTATTGTGAYPIGPRPNITP